MRDVYTIDILEDGMSLKTRRIAVATQLLLLALIIPLAGCNKSDQRSFKVFASPEEAGAALLAAGKSGDQNSLLAIFGPDSKELISSGDAVQDKAVVDAFIASYGEMHRWRKMVDGAQVLLVGADNFAFPIPLKKDGKVVGHDGTWHSGKDGARYGLMVPAVPLLGARHYQEIAPGVAIGRNLQRKHAMEMLLTGDPIDAARALQLGLVNRVVETSELEPAVDELVRKIAPTPLPVLRLTKLALVRAYEAMGLRSAVASNLDLSAILNAAETPEQHEFDRIVAKDGWKTKILKGRDTR